MKRINKVLSLVIAFLMAFVLIIPVNASNKVDVSKNPEINPNITSGTITINKAGSIFEVYKILDAEGKEGQNVYSYSVNSNFAGLIGDNKTYTLKSIADMPNELNIKKYEDGKYVGVEDPITEKTSKFTTDVQAYIEKNNINSVATINDSNPSVNLDLGFYIVVETGTSNTSATVASKSMLVPIPYVDGNDNEGYKWNFELTVEPKDEPVNIDKSIIDEDGNKGDISHGQVGSDVNYQAIANIPHYDASTDLTKVVYVMSDTLSKGLDFKDTSENGVVVKFAKETDAQGNLISPVSLEDAYDLTFEGRTMKLVFNYEKIMSYNFVQLNYTAVINDDAVVGIEGNPNEIKLEYTNNNKTWEKSEPKDITRTYLYGIKLNKISEDAELTKLEDAHFQLYKGETTSEDQLIATYNYVNGQLVLNSDNGNTAVTNKDGIAYLIGFGAGVYTLKETKAPNGYILPNGEMKLEIEETIGTDEDGKEIVTSVSIKLTADGKTTVLPMETLEVTEGDVTIGDGSVAVTTIKNKPGFNLPKTGGEGTWMFAVGGILIMAGMATAFIKLRKKEN